PLFDNMGWNKSGAALSISTRLQQIMNVMSDAIWVGYAWYVPKFFIPQAGPQAESARKMARAILGGFITVPLVLILTSVQKQMINMSQNMQQKLIGVATYINGIKQLITIMGSNTKLAGHMPELKNI